MADAAQTPLLRMRGISKAFPGVQALSKVDLTLFAGEVLALLGENGAGKSTLVKCIYGVHKADAGTLIWEGQETQIANPNFARKLGIGMVFQHFNLFPEIGRKASHPILKSSWHE